MGGEQGGQILGAGGHPLLVAAGDQGIALGSTELVGQLTPEGVDDGAIGIGGGLGGAEGGAHQHGAGGPGNGGDAHLAAHLIEAGQAGQGLAGAEVIEGQHGVGLAATEVGLQLDHRFTALAVEPFEGEAQQGPHAGGNEGTAVELGGVGVLLAADATTHLVEVGGELGLLVLARGHIGVGHDHIAPGQQAGLHLVLNRHLVAGAVAGPIAKYLLLQFLAQEPDRLGGFRRGDVAAEAGGGVEIAIGIVG